MRNNLKKSTLALLAMIFMITVAIAQTSDRAHKHEERIARMTDRLAEELDLTAVQVEKVKALHEKFGARKKAMRDQANEEDRTAKKAAMQQMRKDFDAEMKTILTDAQYAKFEELPKPGRRGHKGGKHRKHNKAAKAFHKEKVQPILLAQRLKLEDKISGEDKQTLAELRTVLKAEKEKRKAEREAHRENVEKGERPDKETRKARREQMKNDPNRLKVKALVEKYQSEIEPLLAEVKPQIKALKEEWKKNNDGKLKQRESKKEGHSKHERHLKKKYAHFLLMDPNATEETAIKPAPVATITDVNIYPNPSQGISQIEYSLQESENITIELHDKNGNILETINQGQQPAGEHKTSINFSQYTVGIYYVVLKNAKGQIVSEKVIR